MPEHEHPTPVTSSRGAHVVVCICTYQRPDGLERLLNGLCEQVFEDVTAPVVSVIVTDNECSDSTRAICDRFVQRCRYSLLYLQEKNRGISYARNTCLDKLPADSDFVAMIDDDEIPEPGWLNHLLYAQAKTAADIVTGPTLPVFDPSTPAWVVDTGYFAKPHHPHRYQDLERFPPTATCNVLIRADVFTEKKLRFDPALALSGSEDKLLFQDLKQQGLSFVWASNAVTHENITAERAKLGYMLSEALRRGSTKFYVKIKLKTSTRGRRYKLALRSAVRSLFGITLYGGSACIYLLGGNRLRHKAALSLLNATENIGFLAGVMGYRKNHY
jgi:succinoglycan biosynthesis protein ExoM